ncbi:unnamed protein product, partial [Tenebrio molitor]
RAQDSRRPRRTTDRHDRYLIFSTLHMSTRSVATAWYNVTARLISMPTIYDWCRERINWDAEWNVVVFSDESRFCCGGTMDDKGSEDYVENGAIQLTLLNGMWLVP